MKNKKIKVLLVAIALLFSCFLTCFTTTAQVAYASNIGIVGGYSDVLDDLQKDENFDANNYPAKQDDYSLQVITIAESTDKELLVYVYQPSAEYYNLRATSINISVTETMSFINYGLSFVNSNGVFYKYRVKNFLVSDDLIRNYEITSIYRPFNKLYDKELENGNIINEVDFKVAKYYSFVTTETGVTFFEKDIDFIEVLDKYVGFVRYEDGVYSSSWGSAWGTFLSPGMDSHFVAFTTDKKIDKLMEADVFFQYQTYNAERTYSSALIKGDYSETFGEINSKVSYIDYTQKVEEVAGNYKYKFNRIQTVAEFETTENYEYVYNGIFFNSTTEVKLTEQGKKDIEGMDWILRFYESDYADYTSYLGTPVTGGTLYTDHIEKTLVSNVTILRLRFETDGVVYNLGVIDNKQTGDGIPDNYTKTTLELTDFAKIILFLLLLIILLVVLWPVLPQVINLICKFVKFIFKAIWWIISTPFKLIGKLFKKRE